VTYFSGGGSHQLSALTLGIVVEKVFIDRHHMTNKREFKHSRSKRNWYGSWNVLMMRRSRHENLHRYFDNLSWEDIRDSIQTGKMYRRKNFIELNEAQIKEALYSIFGRIDRFECVVLMNRVARAKKRNQMLKDNRRSS
jgi:hypothetical protein